MPGDYYVTVRNTGDNSCVSDPSVLTVNPVPGAPSAPSASVTVQPTCAVPTGTITVTSPAEGSGYKYSIDSGASWSDQTTFTGLIPGDYIVSVQDIATGCVSVPVILTVNPVPSAPSAPSAVVSVQPTCTSPTGTITVTSPLGAEYEYSIDGVSYQSAVTFSGLASGDYPVTVRDTGDNSCVSGPSVLTVNPVPGAPSAPTASVTVQPTCAVPTGTITVTSPAEGSGYKYSIDSGASWSDQTTFTGLTSGDYNVSIQDIATGCVSVPVILTVDPVPSAPSAPVAVVSVQPTCTAPTGTITVSAPLGAEYEYSIDGVNYQSAVTFSGLVPGDYYVTIRNIGDNSCVSDPSVLTVNPVPGAPAAPLASVSAQPTCAIPQVPSLLPLLPKAQVINTVLTQALHGATSPHLPVLPQVTTMSLFRILQQDVSLFQQL